MILPYLQFGNIFMLNCTEGDLLKLQITQNKCSKPLLRRDRYYETELLHRNARLPTWRLRALTSAMRNINWITANWLQEGMRTL